MAVEGEEVVEYESDPEDALLPSAMRRREASDDEGGEGSDGGAGPSRRDAGAEIGSDDSEGQGGAQLYEDEEDGLVEGEELEDEMEQVGGLEEGHGGVIGAAVDAAVAPKESRGEVDGFPDNEQVQEEGEPGKKENEPYAVPTVGAFYMHDDRFRDNGRGRHRRMLGGQKLWESKDECAWVHDRFDEMNLQDARHDEERRMKKGDFRGRGRSRARGSDHGYGRWNRPRTHNDGYQQNQAPKIVKGRGPRRYEPSPEGWTYATKYDQYAKVKESVSKPSARRQPSDNLNVPPDPIVTREDAFASSLSSASPPFYPSGSSNQDTSVIQKRDPHIGANKKLSSMQIHEDYATSKSGSLLRGKPTTDSGGNGRKYMHSHVRPISGKTVANTLSQYSESSLSSKNTIQSFHSTAQGRDLKIIAPVSTHGASFVNHAARVPKQTQHATVQQRAAPVPVQSASRVSAQQLSRRPGIVSQGFSSPQAPSATLSDGGETESPPGSSKSRAPLFAKGKASNQGSGMGSFLYNGAQVGGAAGAMSLPHNDQGFPGTPALLPVMQFGGQHHGGLGMPAVGMALPGYVAQQQPGFGNSEMSWVHMLAGGAGALGASYGSPYISIDGSYFAQLSGQSSSSISSKDSSTTKPGSTAKLPERPEITNDEYGQHQNKPRRYSEMHFGQ